MIRLIQVVLFSILFSSTPTFGQFQKVEQQYLQYRNVLKNPGFENGKTGWSETGSGTFSLNTTNNIAGVNAGGFNASAASETFQTDAYSIEDLEAGRACLAEFWYYWETGTSGHLTANVEDSSGELVSDLTLEPTSGTPLNAQMAFTCPAIGETVRLRITSTANADVIYIDNAYVGRDYRMGKVNDQAELIASLKYANTANCTWTRTNTTLGAFSTDADCPAPTQMAGTISATLTDADLPRATIPNLPPGDYVVTVTAPTYVGLAGANGALAISDGTTTPYGVAFSPTDQPDIVPIYVSGTFQYTTTATRTFELYGSTSSNTLNVHLATTSGSARDLVFNIWRSPTQSPRDTVTLETQGWYAEARWTSAGGIALTSGTLGPVNSSDLVGAVSSRNTATLKQACATTEISATMGVSCSGNENLGVVATIPYKGKYKACFKIAKTTTTVSVIYPRVVYAAPNDSSVALQTAWEAVPSEAGVNGGLERQTICGTLDLPAGDAEIALWYQESGAGSHVTAYTDGTNDRSIYFEMYPITQNFPQAVAIANVATGGTSSGCPNGENICSGTYAATSSASVNLTSLSVGGSELWNWSRVGNMVHITGYFAANSSVGGSPPTGVSSFETDLPFAIDLTDGDQCTGTIAGNRSSATLGIGSGYFRANTTNNTLSFTFAATSTGNYGYGFSAICRTE